MIQLAESMCVNRFGVPHPRLIPLLERYGVSWETFFTKARSTESVFAVRRAVIRELQSEGCTWAEMCAITGMSNGTIQRHRDRSVARRKRVYLKKAKPAKVKTSRHLMLFCATCENHFERRCSVVNSGLRMGRISVYCSKHCANLGSQHKFEILDRQAFDYLLGVACGDGCVLRSKKGTPSGVTITVGFADEAYIESLQHIFVRAFGVASAVRPNQKARAIYMNLHGIAIGTLFGSVKAPDGWVLDSIQYPAEFLAGLCDTDGSWVKSHGKHTRRSFSITQKDNGNLERTLPLWEAVGVTIKLYHFDNKYARAVLRIGDAGIDQFKAQIPLLHPRKCI